MRVALAWALYWAGDAVSRLMLRADFLRLYPLYNRLMILSSEVQGASDRGPWSAVK